MEIKVKDSGELSISGAELVKVERGTMEHYVLSKLQKAGAPISGVGDLQKDVVNFHWYQRYDQATDSDVFEWGRK